MEIQELLIYRNQLIDDCRDSNGYISENSFLENCLPWLNETKHIDSTDVTNVYDPLDHGAIKINAYTFSESGERLQLFIINEDGLSADFRDEDLMIAQRGVYEKQFTRVLTFVKKSIKKQLGELLQDGSPAWVLVHQLADSAVLNQIDVIEIFVISATATIESRGTAPSAKMLEFDDDSIHVSFVQDNMKQSKEIVLIKRLIDLNYLYNVQIAQGSRYPLVIDFEASPYNYPIPFLHAASEDDFDSYLCSIPAKLLAELYKRHSSRLLEKNVRSFLQLKGVNKGMQETIRKEPEKFIAYNNGLTITATSSEIININNVPHLKTLSDFQIVNGGQTTATIYFSRKNGLQVDNVRVMAKINVARNATEDALDDLISNISTYSNAQSKVSKVDLRARSSQLVKLKSLSESILTVSGKKWFFERAKGEYLTMMRINSAKKTQLEKTYPKERRFTKEELAKYYSSWGDKPYAVKKGGEKIFRLFLEEISGEGKSKKGIAINRSFYEDLISRIILFRSLEKLYGSGNSSLGQLRSAVVPYSISAVYVYTNGNRKSSPFDLLRIWKAEKLDDDLVSVFTKLMKLMNSLIKKYSKSDDLGEYSKKTELWEDISFSNELQVFMEDQFTKNVLKKYSISAEEMKKREKEAVKEDTLDFEPLLDLTGIYDRGIKFYQEVLHQISDKLSESKIYKINEIISALKQEREIDERHIQFEKELLRTISIENPELLKSIQQLETYKTTATFIVRKYNNAISNSKDIQATFDVVKDQAKRKGLLMSSSVFSDIGKRLANNEMPTISQIKQVSDYCLSIV